MAQRGIKGAALYVGGVADVFPKVLKGSATYNPASLTTGTSTSTTVTVTGAAVGDPVLAGFFGANQVAGISITAWVGAADTVTVAVHNSTAGTVDLGSATLSVLVFKF